MSASRSALLSEAASFLTNGAVMAWESQSAQRIVALVTAFTKGEIDAAGLRAAVGGDRSVAAPRPTKGSTAIIPLVGVLSPGESLFTLLGLGTSIRSFMRALAQAGADRSVRAICIYTDSPGGSVRMLPEAAQQMRAVRAVKPVVVATAGLNASASYWLTSNATTIESTPSGDVGSVGVYFLRTSIVKRLAQEGLDVETFAAPQHKAEGLETTAITDAERTRHQAVVEGHYTDFVNDVAAGRQVQASLVRASYGEGRLVSAKDALSLGMIDRIRLTEQTFADAGSARDRMATLQARRTELTRAGLEGHRLQQIHADIASRRRELAAAAQGRGPA